MPLLGRPAELLGDVCWLAFGDEWPAAKVAELQADLGVTSQAIEELLRLTSVVQFQVRRVTTDDVELGGTVVPKGSPLIAVANSANHDFSKFPAPTDSTFTVRTRHLMSRSATESTSAWGNSSLAVSFESPSRSS